MHTAHLLLLALSSAAPAGDPAVAVSPEGTLEPRVVFLDRVSDVHAARAASERLLAGTPVGSFLSTNQDPEGDMPRQVTFSADGSEVLVANRDTDTLVFFDVATRSATHTVAVGDFPVDVAVSADGRVAVVPNVFANTVSVVDVATHTLLAHVPVSGVEPYRVAITPDSAFAVVGVIEDAVTSSVSVIDLDQLVEVRTFSTVSQGVYGFFFTPEPGISGNLFTDMELSPDGATLVVPDRGNSRVALYDVATGAETLLATAAVPGDCDVSLDSSTAVVEHGSTSRTVTVIDLVAGAVSAAWLTPNNLFSGRIRITPDKTHAIVGVLNEVQFVNLATGAIAATVSTGSVGDIEISFDGQFAFVSNFNSRVIDIATRAQVAILPLAAAADAAASPVEHRMVALNNRFREDVHFYSTAGAGSFVEGRALSGEIEEGDAPRTLAASADGQKVLAVHNTSNNVAVIDVSSGSVEAYLPVGERSLNAAITPDGAEAIVTNATSDTVTILDLTNLQAVSTLFVPDSPAEVVVSPDGHNAYVTSLAGTDRIWFLSMEGAASEVLGSLVTGQMGSIGYTYGVFSGMALSADGSTLAICISFSDELMLVDTASMSEVARVPVGDFPIRVAFSPDGSRAYVTNSFSDDLYAVDVNGAASSVAGVVPGIDFPLEVDVDDDGAFAYVGSFNSQSPSLRVIDTASLTQVQSIPLPSQPRASHLEDDELFVALAGGDLARIRAAGAASSVLDSVALTGGSPSDLAYSAAWRTAFAAQPGPLDGLDVLQFLEPTPYCVAAPNSRTAGATISSFGSTSIAANEFALQVVDLPFDVHGLFFYGDTQIQVPFGDGFLCVGGSVQRLYPPVHSGPGGSVTRALDFTVPPVGAGPNAITAGSTWNFQLWYRDAAAGGSGFNTSDALEVLFVP